jgi:hypothetical protein
MKTFIKAIDIIEESIYLACGIVPVIIATSLLAYAILDMFSLI